MGRNKKMSSKVLTESIDCDCEDLEECGPVEDVDFSNCSVISSFSFRKEDATSGLSECKLQPSGAEPKLSVDSNKPSSGELTAIGAPKTQAYGITPPVDGEYFEVKRTFVFRRSTLRMLNMIKAEHPDENVYLSSILDEALRHYYDHILTQIRIYASAGTS
jgi:hypothetical protein